MMVGTRRARGRVVLLAVAVAVAAGSTGTIALAADTPIASPPGAQALGPAAYVLPTHPLPKGSTATYTNGDILLHDVVALEKGTDGAPLFRSKLVGLGGQAPVEGVERLDVGSYRFTCSLHSSMLGVLEVVATPLPATAPPGEAPLPTDWPMFGRDLANSRHGASGPSAAQLPAYSASWQLADGPFVGTPVVGGWRMFTGTSTGRVVSLDRTTGDRVWERELGADVTVTASPAYHDGVVYVPAVVPDGGPHVVALRAGDGLELWRTAIDEEQSGGDHVGSPVVWEDIDGSGGRRARLFVGTASSGAAHLGTVVALDLIGGGDVLWRTYMAEGGPHLRADVPAGVGGAGVASPPAVDATTGTVYVGTGGGDGGSPALSGSLVALSAEDGALLDRYQASTSSAFASPQLIAGAGGKRWVGAGEQGGPGSLARYHVVDGATMEQVWAAAVGPAHPSGGTVGATAYDGERIYGATMWGQLFALDVGDGSLVWVTRSGGTAGHVAHTQVAKGIVYAATAGGIVGAWDAATGESAWTSPVDPGALPQEVTVPGPSEGAVAVVGDTLIVGNGRGVTAYRAPGG